MSWVYLCAAIVLEICGGAFLKLSNGFAKIIYIFPMLACYIGSLLLFSLVLKKIEIGIAYALWAGIGTALIAVVGIIFFKEVLNVQKMVFIIFILVGVVGLNMIGAGIK
jgi:small multidrug resistance pump